MTISGEGVNILPKLKLQLTPTLDSGITLRTVGSEQELEQLLDEYGQSFNEVDVRAFYIVDDSPAAVDPALADPAVTDPTATTTPSADPAAADPAAQTTVPTGGE